MSDIVDTVSSRLSDVVSRLAFTIPYGSTLKAFRDFESDVIHESADTETREESLAKLKAATGKPTLPFAKHLFSISQNLYDVKTLGQASESL